MVDSCCIFHAENDAVGRFSLSPHIVEFWFLCNQREHQSKFDSSIRVSIWLHTRRNQNSTIWGDSEERSTASFSAWKIQQESTIRTLENFNFFLLRCVIKIAAAAQISANTIKILTQFWWQNSKWETSMFHSPKKRNFAQNFESCCTNKHKWSTNIRYHYRRLPCTLESHWHEMTRLGTKICI